VEPTDGDVVANGVVYKKSKRPGGRWSSDEHKRFIEALRIYGKDWQ
jgi:hypothetical protein